MALSTLARNLSVMLLAMALAACGSDTAPGSGSESPAIAGNAPPQISGSPPSTVASGTTFEFVPQAVDADGDSLSFSISNAPAWASFDAATGALRGTPQSGDEGTYNAISISVTDGADVDELPAFSLTVVAPDFGTLVLTWLPPTESTDGSPATDLRGYRIYYGPSAGKYTGAVTVDNAGLTSYVIEGLAPGTWHVAMSAIDSAGQESALSAEVTRFVAQS